MKNNIINFDEYYYLENNYQELKKLASKSYFDLIYSNFKGISILEPLSKVITKDLIYLLKCYQETYENMSVFTINIDNKERIVIRRKNPEYKNIDLKVLDNIAETSYQNGDYDEARRSYLKILQGEKEPEAYVYQRLGELFPDFGLDYLIIAVGLATGKTKENYQNILEEARYNKEHEQEYTIDDLDEILDYIEQSELNVEESCLCLGLNREETDIIKLKIARIYFTNKHYDKGEEFIRNVESTPGKTKNVKNLLNEVVANKKIYSNDIGGKTLSLKLKPGKPMNFD